MTDTELFPISLAHLDALRERLAAEAAEAGDLDLAYRTVDSPVGALLLAATPAGLARVAFASEDHDSVLDTLARRIGGRILRSTRRLDLAAMQLDEYFQRTRHSFELALDDRLSSGFRRDVQRSLPQIPYGHTRTYGEVAASLGNPRAVRAVGTACSTNPLPIVVPCHRVLRADGSIGGYAGGPATKEALLNLERGAPGYL